MNKTFKHNLHVPAAILLLFSEAFTLKAGELSLSRGMPENATGWHLSKWLDSEGLFPGNYRPGGLLPAVNIGIMTNQEYVDPVFLQLIFVYDILC